LERAIGVQMQAGEDEAYRGAPQACGLCDARRSSAGGATVRRGRPFPKRCAEESDGDAKSDRPERPSRPRGTGATTWLPTADSV
jgi:hypothetical protein